MDLFDAVALAGFGAGRHFRLFNHALAVLHLDALAGALALIDGVAHAETAPARKLRLGRRGGALQGESCHQNDSENRSHTGLRKPLQNLMSRGAGQVTEVIESDWAGYAVLYLTPCSGTCPRFPPGKIARLFGPGALPVEWNTGDPSLRLEYGSAQDGATTMRAWAFRVAAVALGLAMLDWLRLSRWRNAWLTKKSD